MVAPRLGIAVVRCTHCLSTRLPMHGRSKQHAALGEGMGPVEAVSNAQLRIDT